MPRVPTEPVPELTVRGTVRKNQLYVPEEDIQRALQMVRDGVYVARASRLCKVPFTRLEARVKELKDSGELEIYWGKNAPHYLAKLNEQNAPDEIGDGGGKTKRKRRSGHKPYSEENLALAVEAVKSGMYTINAAHNVYNIPGKLLYEVMRTDKPIRALMNKKNRNKAKLTYNEEEAVVEYALALDKIGFLVTYMSLVPLAMQYTTDRGNPVKDVHGWAKLFARRHPELDGKYLSPPAVRAITKQQLAKKMFDRLAELYDTHNFHLKPSRIYACEGISLRVERWEADETKNIDVEMLVAANAVGFHILPPCVVYSNEEGDGIPDFLGLPEAGFVVSDKKKLTAPIVAEWFRSVFLHYLLPRTAEDPVALVLHGHHDWFSPELLQMAEKEHVHLVPVCPQIRFWTNPLQSILLKLRDAYVDSMRSYKMSQIGKVQDRFEVEAFPVPLLTLFSEHFTMCRVQEAFKSAGLFPLKPEQVELPKEEPVRKSKSKKKAKGTKTNAKESEKVANVSNQKTKSNGLESLVVQSSNSGESILLKVCSEVVLNSDGASTSNGDGKTSAVTLLESMQKSLSANKEPNLDMKASRNNDTVPIITPVKNPTGEEPAVSTSSATSSQPATSTSKSEPVTFTLHSQDASTPEPKQDSHFNTEVLNSIVVVKKQNEDRRSYVMLKKMTSTRPKTTGIPTAYTQPKMTDMPTTSTVASSAVTTAVPTTPSSSVQQTTAIPTLSPQSINPPQPSATQPIPVKITKADEDATSFPSCDVSLGVATSSTPVSSNSAPGSTGNTSTSSTPVSSNSGPGSTGNTSFTTDVTTVTTTSASSSTDAVESDSDDNDSDLDISEVDVEPSNTASILKQPKPVLTTPSTSILDHIQSVIAKNTDILSSSDIKKSKTSRKANKAASKSAVSTIKPSVSEPRKAPSQTTIPTTTARTSSVPILNVNKPSGSEPQMAPSQTTIPTVPISVIAAKLQQHVLSQRRKPNPSVRAQVAQSHQSATSATISAPFKQQSTITAGGRNLVPSQGSAITSSTLVPSTSGGALPSVAVTPISLQQQPQVSKSQAQLTKSEAATLSKIAKAFNADVADIILAVKNQQKTLASQRRPLEKTSGSQPSSNQARIAPAPANPAVPLIAPVVTVYNPLQQAQGAPILVSGGTLFPIVQQRPLIFPLPQATMGMIPVTGVPTVAPAVTNTKNTPSATATTSASATASAATKNKDSSIMGENPVTVVTNVAHAVTNTKLTPSVVATTYAPATVSAAVTSTNKGSSTMGVTPVTVVTNVAHAVTNNKLTPTVIATTSAPTISVRASATVVPSVKSGSSSFSVKPKVTSDKVMIVTERHTETTSGVRIQHEESSSKTNKVDSQNPSLRISPQAQDVTVVYAKTSGNSAETSRQDKIDSQNTSVTKLPQKQAEGITNESDVQTSGSSSRTSSGYTVVTVRKSSQKQVLVTSVEPSTSGTPKADTQSHNPTAEAVTEQLSTITSENSEKSDNGSAVVATFRKSPRKQVMVTREEPGEPSTSNPSKIECESPVVTGSRKRKASLISSTKMDKRKEDSDKGVKMLGAETVAEGRKTRAQVREESLPSRRTRSMKR